MDRAEMLTQLKEVLRNIEGHNDAVIDAATEDTSLKNELGLNSIGMLYIMIVLEEKYEISFESAKMDDFKTLSDVMDFIEKES